MAYNNDLYLGLDLSTQQLRGILVSGKTLTPVGLVRVEFDKDFPQYKTKKGVHVNRSKPTKLVNASSRTDGEESDVIEIQAPVNMWLESVDLLFKRLSEGVSGLEGVDVLKNLVSISGACQQHGSVFWNDKVGDVLKTVGNDTSSSKHTLKELFDSTLAWDLSPNWQDHSTGFQCAAFEKAVGGPQKLAEITGSSAHHRFTGPQILKLKQTQPEIYEQTSRISLVSSFLATILANNDGKVVDLDLSDACGMNLWDIKEEKWNETLVNLIDNDTVGKANASSQRGLLDRLGKVYFPRTITKDGQSIAYSGDASEKENTLKPINQYFVSKYGVNPKCTVTVPFTGDNPSTILSQALGPDDVMISLGTSTTALVITKEYKPSPQYHVFAHPEDRGMYMGMLCYSNGALAREQVRDKLNQGEEVSDDEWEKFTKIANTKLKAGQVLGINSKDERAKLGIYFPLAEIIPPVEAQLKFFEWSKNRGAATSPTARVLKGSHTRDTELWELVAQSEEDAGHGTKPSSSENITWNHPEDDVMGILESQALSVRHRLQPMLVGNPDNAEEVVKRPRRVFAVGGGSKNKVMCQVISRVLSPIEGTFRLAGEDSNGTSAQAKAVSALAADACAAGAAFKAVYETFLSDSADASLKNLGNSSGGAKCGGESGDLSNATKPEAESSSEHDNAISSRDVYRYCDFISDHPPVVSRLDMPPEVDESDDIYGRFIDVYAQSEALVH